MLKNIEVVTLRARSHALSMISNFGSLQRGMGSQAGTQFYRLRSRFSKCLITVSDSARKSLEEAGLKPRSFHVIHNGVDLEQFQPFVPDREGMKSACYPSRILPRGSIWRSTPLLDASALTARQTDSGGFGG